MGPVGGFLELNTAVTIMFVTSLGGRKKHIRNHRLPPKGIHLCNDKKMGGIGL